MTTKIKKRKDPLRFKKSEVIEIKRNAGIIEYLFKTFGTNVKVMEVNNFRKYIQYCLDIELGTPVEDILKKEKDIALVLASPTGKIKVLTPVPNKPYIGINVPKRRKGQKEYIKPDISAISKPIAETVSELNGISQEEIEELVDESLHLLMSNKYEIVSAPLFQRVLMLDENKATILFGELQKLNVILNPRTNPEDADVLIADVDISTVRKMMVN